MAPLAWLVVSIMACKSKSQQKRSTGVLANQVARIVTANQFPTAHQWPEATLGFFIHGGEAHSSLHHECITEEAAVPHFWPSWGPFLLTLPLAFQFAHALWNTILLFLYPSWSSHPPATIIHLLLHSFLFLTGLSKVVKGQDWEKTSNQARRKQLSKCSGENASFKITENLHATKEFQNILHHCCKILSGKQVEMGRKISFMVSQNES